MKFSSAIIIFCAAFIACKSVNAAEESWLQEKECRRKDKGECSRRQLAVSGPESHECVRELYDLSVVVGGVHIALAAKPKCDGSLRSNECKECPAFFFHATPSSIKGEEKQMEKVIHEYDFDVDDEVGLVLGTFDLGTLVEAFNNAPVGASKKYNLFLNNCAGLPINMGLNLGIDPTDRKIIKFVSRNLSKKAPLIIMDELSNHEAGIAMIQTYGKEDATIEAFVSTYIHDRV